MDGKAWVEKLGQGKINVNRVRRKNKMQDTTKNRLVTPLKHRRRPQVKAANGEERVIGVK